MHTTFMKRDQDGSIFHPLAAEKRSTNSLLVTPCGQSMKEKTSEIRRIILAGTIPLSSAQCYSKSDKRILHTCRQHLCRYLHEPASANGPVPVRRDLSSSQLKKIGLGQQSRKSMGIFSCVPFCCIVPLFVHRVPVLLSSSFSGRKKINLFLIQHQRQSLGETDKNDHRLTRWHASFEHPRDDNRY